MGGVGLNLGQPRPAGVVESMHQGRVPGVRVRRRDVLDPMTDDEASAADRVLEPGESKALTVPLAGAAAVGPAAVEFEAGPVSPRSDAARATFFAPVLVIEA